MNKDTQPNDLSDPSTITPSTQTNQASPEKPNRVNNTQNPSSMSPRSPSSRYDELPEGMEINPKNFPSKASVCKGQSSTSVNHSLRSGNSPLVDYFGGMSKSPVNGRRSPEDNYMGDRIFYQSTNFNPITTQTNNNWNLSPSNYFNNKQASNTSINTSKNTFGPKSLQEQIANNFKPIDNTTITLRKGSSFDENDNIDEDKSSQENKSSGDDDDNDNDESYDDAHKLLFYDDDNEHDDKKKESIEDNNETKKPKKNKPKQSIDSSLANNNQIEHSENIQQNTNTPSFKTNQPHDLPIQPPSPKQSTIKNKFDEANYELQIPNGKQIIIKEKTPELSYRDTTQLLQNQLNPPQNNYYQPMNIANSYYFYPKNQTNPMVNYYDNSSNKFQNYSLEEYLGGNNQTLKSNYIDQGKKGSMMMGNNMNMNNKKIKRLEPSSYENVPYEELVMNIYLLAKDQGGCRYLQKRLDEDNDPTILTNIIYPPLVEHIPKVINDPFGNYLIQKILPFLSPKQLYEVLNIISPQILEIGKDGHGTRVIQELLKHLQTKDLREHFLFIIKPYIIPLLNELNGTHIIQKFCEIYPSYEQSINILIIENCLSLAKNRHGCCVLQKYLQIFPQEMHDKLLNKLLANCLVLVIDQFGNYVIQSILYLKNIQASNTIALQLLTNIVYYSNHKYSSNVVEKCFDYCDKPTRQKLIEVLACPTAMNDLILNDHGNYVLQKVLACCDYETQGILLQGIVPLFATLKDLSFGGRIMSKLFLSYPQLNNMISPGDYKDYRNPQVGNYSKRGGRGSNNNDMNETSNYRGGGGGSNKNYNNKKKNNGNNYENNNNNSNKYSKGGYNDSNKQKYK